MASVNMSLTVAVALFSGFLILGAVVGEDECGFLCVEGAYVTCANYPGQQFPGCDCVCAPPGGQGCVIHDPVGGTPDEPCTK